MNFVICINNQDYDVSLEKCKVYQLIDSPSEKANGFFRIIGESGEDYLYPEEFFMSIQLPKRVQEALVT